jgi:hypothetical protein
MAHDEKRLSSMFIRVLFSSVFGLVLVSACLTQGCSVMGYDHREKIARAVLYDGKGNIDEKVFSSALFEKFSHVNSPPTALTGFVQSLGGNCSKDPKNLNQMHCSIPVSGTICVESRIDLFIVTGNGDISSITAKRNLTGC